MAAAATRMRQLLVNGRHYSRPLRAPVVGVCLDGSAQDYVDAAGPAVMPHWHARLASGEGSHGLVRAAMPTFTNPNNLSIVTGATPAVHGISGNFFLDESGKETMMNDPKYVRVPTLLAELSASGTPVACVTAKGKLLRMLKHGLDPEHSFGFSVEHAATPETSGVLESAAGIAGGCHALNPGFAAPPGIYEPDCSIYCLESGLRLLERGWGGAAPVLYLSTTDYVQHKHPPGSPEANEFYAKIDRVLAGLSDVGAVVGVTADHGMNDKMESRSGQPAVLFLESKLHDGGIPATVILPITDPYVVHHAALGGYATVYLRSGAQLQEARALLSRLPGVEVVLTQAEAAARFELPGDRIGHLVVVADADTVLGRTPEYHDLTAVPQLRSHGALAEEWVPLWINRRLESPEWEARLASGGCRNFDLFDLLLNAAPP